MLEITGIDQVMVSLSELYPVSTENLGNRQNPGLDNTHPLTPTPIQL